jgi:hypothetical protein
MFHVPAVFVSRCRHEPVVKQHEAMKPKLRWDAMHKRMAKQYHWLTQLTSAARAAASRGSAAVSPPKLRETPAILAGGGYVKCQYWNYKFQSW